MSAKEMLVQEIQAAPEEVALQVLHYLQAELHKRTSAGATARGWPDDEPWPASLARWAGAFPDWERPPQPPLRPAPEW
jgi:hypothetical protein